MGSRCNVRTRDPAANRPSDKGAEDAKEGKSERCEDPLTDPGRGSWSGSAISGHRDIIDRSAESVAPDGLGSVWPCYEGTETSAKAWLEVAAVAYMFALMRAEPV